MMKSSAEKMFGLVLIALVLIACNLSEITTPPTIAPTKTKPAPITIVAATPVILPSATLMPTASATLTPPVQTQTPDPGAKAYQFGNLSMVVPGGLASTVTIKVIPEVRYDRRQPWLVAPPYILGSLVGYAAPDGTYLTPELFIYPAKAYADASLAANINLQRIRTILANPSLPLTDDMLPRLPFTPGEQSLAAQIKTLAFQDGGGVRFVTQYDFFLDPALTTPGSPIVNRLLFYHFEGLSADGKSYIIVILPLSVPLLANDPNPDAAVPTSGVQYPGSGTDTPRIVYFGAVRDLLNSASPDSFSPSLGALDALVNSLRITP